jgi:subtilisin family serine protease
MWGAQRIGMPAAWGASLGSPSVVIAVLDSGVTANADLGDAILPGIDIVNGDSDPSDDNGHGTEVAQVAAGRIDNGVGGAGICPRCSILPVKVAGADGRAWTTDIDAGIVWAVDHGAAVINLSLAGVGSASVHDDAVAYARSAGVSVVAGAGNDGTTTPEYPANAPGVVSVAASGPSESIETWSTRGTWVDLAAPGEAPVIDRDGRSVSVQGTSFAAPVVAGALGLLASVAPASTMDDRERALAATAVPVAPPGTIGGGRVDIGAAVLSLLGTAPLPSVEGAPVVMTTAPAAGVTYTRASTVRVAWSEVPAPGETVAARTVTRMRAPVAKGVCTWTWVPDGDATAAAEPVFVAGGLADGACYRWRIDVTDASGRIGTTVSRVVLVDRHKPAVRPVTPKKTTTTHASTITFRWKTDDAARGSGVVKTTITWEIGRPTATGCTGWKKESSRDAPTPLARAQVSGPICVRLRVTAVDRAGNATTVRLPAYRHP